MYSNGQGGNRQVGNGGGRRAIVRHGRARTRTGPGRAAPPERQFARDRELGPFLDYHSRRGAEVLARRIETYWRSLGFNVRTWLVPLEQDAPDVLAGNARNGGRGALWFVRSSLANGLPPGRGNPFRRAGRHGLSGIRSDDAGSGGCQFTASGKP